VEPFKNWDKTGIMLAAYTMEFKIPVYLNDKLFIDTAITRIGTKSFTMEYDFVVETDTGEITKAFGTSVLVYYDYKNLVSLPVPALWRQKANEFHGTSF
jgi:acyl-CoA thioester hydrolase